MPGAATRSKGNSMPDDSTPRGGSRKDGPILGSLPEGVARLHAAIDCWCGHDSRHYETVNGTSIVHVGCAKCDALAEIAPELVAALKAVEWGGSARRRDYPSCPSCEELSPQHAQSCQLAAALRKAEGNA